MSYLRKYDYRCPDGHIFERTLIDYTAQVDCRCGKVATLIWTKFPGTLAHSNAQRFDPVTVFRKPDGSLYVPGRSNEPTPDGMKRIELTSASQVRDFERRENARLKEVKAQKLEREDNAFKPLKKAKREELKRKMRDFSGPGRKFAEFAMAQSDKRPSQSHIASKFDPGFYAECFSVDSANRLPHNDTDTCFKDRR